MSTGPFVEKDGIRSDREIWKNDMDPEKEKKFDNYMQVKAVNEEARKELARRKVEKAFESLMEGFGEGPGAV